MDVAEVAEVREVVAEMGRLLERLQGLTTPLEGQRPFWVFPVGTAGAPVAEWYCAQYHTFNGKTGHTGLDLNLDRAPWGDVDRGEPVYAVTAGVVESVGFSESWRGVVVLRVEHEGKPLWVRYAHLEREPVMVDAGQEVSAGYLLGRLGDYQRGAGGDHLHFDMALDAFGWNYWLTPGIRWVDPVRVLRAHLPAEWVEAMLARG